MAVASGTDMDFSLAGLSAALISTLAQTFMNISIKKVRASTGMVNTHLHLFAFLFHLVYTIGWSGSKAFMGMAIVCSILIIPFMYVASYQRELFQGMNKVKSPMVTIGVFCTSTNTKF